MTLSLVVSDTGFTLGVLSPLPKIREKNDFFFIVSKFMKDYRQ